ncbi:protein containg FOG: LysM repeat [Longilinea arvoryzae]|uniref:Protein containg FOG: LysM repeat n=1 Tax=Longilinea arvoryzae TaxID=360412 RepID=A0A0S7BCX3_9CHLR|nr:protein containg FOG: LysM repeat [Longilinea arvoryzae]
MWGIAIRYKVGFQELKDANPSVDPRMMSVGTVLIIPASAAATPTPLPTLTPTPMTHTVQKGEDMWGIAIRYKVGFQELKDANPSVDPRMMSVGTVLIIPASAAATPTVPVEELSATPVGLQLGQANCLPEASGGTWCFLPVTNPESFAVENVTAVLRAVDAGGNPLPDQVANPPLNLLLPGETLPLLAFFPSTGAQPAQINAELASAVPVPTEPTRYLGLAQIQPRVQIAADGLSATLSATLKLASPDAQASQVWLLGVGYDAAGRVVGVRRWESTEALPVGGALDAELTLYSAGDPITRVAVLAEARP